VNEKSALSQGNRAMPYERQTKGPNFPRHISSYRARSDKIPTATPMFSGSQFLLAVLRMSPDVDLSRKSKMAAELPEVLIIW